MDTGRVVDGDIQSRFGRVELALVPRGFDLFVVFCPEVSSGAITQCSCCCYCFKPDALCARIATKDYQGILALWLEPNSGKVFAGTRLDDDNEVGWGDLRHENRFATRNYHTQPFLREKRVGDDSLEGQ